MDETSGHKTLLGADCQIVGEFHLDNDAVFAGRFDGSMMITGTLDLPRSAKVTGTVIVGRLRLAGTVDADVIAHQSIELFPGAELRGRIFTPRLKTSDDCVVDGQACLGPNAITQAKAILDQHATDESTETPEPTAASPTDLLYSTAMRNQTMPDEPARESDTPQAEPVAAAHDDGAFNDDQRYPDVKSFEVHFSAKDLSKPWSAPVGETEPTSPMPPETDASPPSEPAVTEASPAADASEVQVRSESVFEMLQRRRPRVLRPVNSSSRSEGGTSPDAQGESPPPPAA